MQSKNISFHELLSRLRVYFQETDPSRKYANEQPPLRAELYSTTQMEQYGEALAKMHQTENKRASNILLKRLSENEKILHEVRDLLADTIKENGLVTPAGEWLLDNFYLVEEHIYTGKQHLPKGYSEGLPRLLNGPSAGLPRVYDIALEIIAHSDGRIDLQNIGRFIAAYQHVSVLELGELWAIPIMLRLALIENLRRVSARIAVDRINQKLADQWSDLMIETEEKDPKSLILVLADMARSGPPMESSFVAELTRQLMWKGPALTLPLTWVEQRLSENGMTTTRLVDMENQKQAADQVSISNTIGSLRFVNTMDWRDFVESMSTVEAILRQDPAGVYAGMDFSTRDHYRHVIERIAKYSPSTETQVAEIAYQLSQDAVISKEASGKKKHIGYYLIDKGVTLTEKEAQLALPIKRQLVRFFKRMPFTTYISGIIFLGTLITAGLLYAVYDGGAQTWLMIALGVFALTSASQVAIAVVNWLATLWVRPDLLPRLDLSEQIPEALKSLVVIPTMISNKASVVSLVEGLEIRFLANRKDNLFYALLTDFNDAHQQVMPDDDAVLAFAQEKIGELNERYKTDKDLFFLFHRPRKWNQHDKVWMGYERKRGKLGALNELLLNGDAEEFSVITGNIDVLKGVKYIITLDTDTQMPRDMAWKMIATMAHPLNQPVYSAEKGRVTEGYGILQPRVCVNIPRSDSSLYVRLHANDTGIDPYTRLTSDVYQDVFHEGSFIGKGIYEIETFEKALKDRFPENRILSHDLIEGCYIKSGLASDIQLYEDNPGLFSTDVNRRHRWIRGDWQVGWWAFPVVPDAARKLHKNPLTALSRWKIFDNLRRSLVPAALMLLLIIGVVFLKNPIFWIIVTTLMIGLPSFIGAVWGVFKKSKDITFHQHITGSLASMRDSLLQAAFTLACLPFEAYYTVDAIIRTSWRMIVSNKQLLQWKPSGSLEHNSNNTPANAYKSMWINPLAGICLGIYTFINDKGVFWASLPLLLLWVITPFITWWISRKAAKKRTVLSPAQTTYLRKLSRKTWAYFEAFVNEENNWLPPDNFQEHPKGVVAYRTSPTNIGLALLANLSAYDFGYITGDKLLQRTAHTLTAMGKLERSYDHFYNWYDTITLAPLPPRYISAVDSGNLAGHLLTLKQGLIEIQDRKIVSKRVFVGLRDTLHILEDQVSNKASLHNFKILLEQVINEPLISLLKVVDDISALTEEAKKILNGLDRNRENDSIWWAESLLDQCQDINNELSANAPWCAQPDQIKDIALLSNIPSLRDIATLSKKIEQQEITGVSNELKETVLKAAENADKQLTAIKDMCEQCESFADMQYDFLYDKSKHLLAIGYNVDERKRDASYYDLLASEARLCNFVAIAQNKLPQESWFSLGRSVTDESGSVLLLSWSGSMFEYLMPLMVMPTYEQTLLHQTYKAVIERQIAYGKKRGVPWGISESGYNRVDAANNYQYKAFGVPGTGLKRGLGDDLVIAPYASAMALMVMPEEACNNLQQLSAMGFEGKYGFYEAIDYTPSRLPRGQSNAVIKSFMVHHQGMSLLSLAYLLHDQPMQRRFEAELRFQATLLLLQEKIPRVTMSLTHTVDVAEVKTVVGDAEMRYIDTPHTPIPEIQLLSNGTYNVMVTNAGGGYSKWKDMAVTRWREDTIRDNWGTFCYIADVDQNVFWSNTHQPTLTEAQYYEAVFTQGRAEFKRTDYNVETQTEIVVSPEDDVELRRIRVVNRSRKRRTLEITSYGEVVLNVPAADEVHPAFSNLFVQTEIQEDKHAIICTRRPKGSDEQVPWMCHIVKINGIGYKEVSYETSRAKFIGRGNTPVAPQAVTQQGKMSGTSGSVLDPIVSVRYKIVLEPGGMAIFDIICGITDNKDTCLALVDKYQDKHLRDRVLELAWTHSQVVLRQINANESDAQMYGRLASSIIYVNPQLRTDAATIANNHKGQSGLWGYAISGDLPIVLLKIHETGSIELVKQMLQAHTYWRMKGLAVDLVIWNEDYGGYRQTMQDEIVGLISAGMGANYTDRPGGIFLRPGDQISKEDRVLFETVARVIITDERGTLSEQIGRKNIVKAGIPFMEFKNKPEPVITTPIKLKEELQFFNGTGGYSADGKEYIIITDGEQRTPAPWVNVLANPDFGTIVSESGQAYTWTGNAHEDRLTPWHNDPVSDLSGEQIYLRDEETGYVWSPVPLPMPAKSTYITRHGFGYSVFEHIENGVHSELYVFVDIEKSIKFYALKLRNTTGVTRKISATGYIEWVLGDLIPKSARYIVSEQDKNTGTLFARNEYNTEFNNQIVFFDTDDMGNCTFTCDRKEFIGRNGTLAAPEALQRERLSNKSGAGYDPCAAIQLSFDLIGGQEKEIVFRLGVGKDASAAAQLASDFKGTESAWQALEKVKNYWSLTLDVMKIATPDPSLNLLSNGWLLYQAIVCRLWARSGYYQSGGAFGFRDQLQDVLAIMYTRPEFAKAQILLSASRQFEEGDVQHWWHPPYGRGVRTTCSDDYLWLPFVVAKYVQHTGDAAILDENVSFLSGRQLNPGEESYYDLPGHSSTVKSLYQHCILAINHGLRFGEHGLPLMGSGDWNDGMDKVGKHGKGESVWLAFFLYDVLQGFAKIATAHKDDAYAQTCIQHAQELKTNINNNGWDGKWYRRAYFDDGSPLGSASNEECSIDSISQSWSVLSDGGYKERSLLAMDAVYNRLVDKNNGLIQLLDPPFDKSALEPGYIKGYVPGVRENGGQYSHAAIWTVMAFAAIGDNNRTWELLDMINPVNHARSVDDVAKYKVEPYVMAADIYKEPTNLGRGGWTWYTGSAGWMYQCIIQSFLGIVQEGDKLVFIPCLPPDWPYSNITYHYMDTIYEIMLKSHADKRINVVADGIQQQGNSVTLVNDGQKHTITVG